MKRDRDFSDKRTEKRNKVLLVLALLFFLLGLGVWANNAGIDLMERLGITGGSGMFGGAAETTQNGGQRGPAGPAGQTGPAGTSGTDGTSGTNGTNGDNGGDGGNGQGTNVNVNSDGGVNIDAGVDKDGAIYVRPTVSPNTQGGTGVEVKLNDDKVIDTNAL